ncbi:hypothetical protein J6590_056776 [Homalodisca vitripennis]|nr:hypothetical protein J6590_056776 [Homalodisca vitripennis]
MRHNTGSSFNVRSKIFTASKYSQSPWASPECTTGPRTLCKTCATDALPLMRGQRYAQHQSTVTLLGQALSVPRDRELYVKQSLERWTTRSAVTTLYPSPSTPPSPPRLAWRLIAPYLLPNRGQKFVGQTTMMPTDVKSPNIGFPPLPPSTLVLPG